MGSFEDVIASTVLRTFDSLPPRCKPCRREDGVREWTTLSGIVVSDGGSSELRCVSLGMGLKCLPQQKLAIANGNVLHDWHAETLAIRSFNRFLIQECHDLATSGLQSSTFIKRREEYEMTDSIFQPFTVQPKTEIYMYCSEAPCGDASMELVMAAQDDPTPWNFEKACTGVASKPDDVTPLQTLHGRGYFSELGVVRRKPSRVDAPPTLSKSCSDKLALKQCTSLLSSPASMLLCPENAYLHSLVLPKLQYSERGCHRSFGPEGRMKPASTMTWQGGYAFRPFTVGTTDVEFPGSRKPSTACEKPPGSQVPLTISTVYVAPPSSSANSGDQTTYDLHKTLPTERSAKHSFRPRTSIQETLINGVLQGRKQSDMKGSCSISRRSMWMAVLSAIGKLSQPGPLRPSLTLLPHCGEGLAPKISGRVPNGKVSPCAISQPPWASMPKGDLTTQSPKVTHPKGHRTMKPISSKKSMTYKEFKSTEIFNDRRNVKQAVTASARGPLKGWFRNEGDDEFYL